MWVKWRHKWRHKCLMTLLCLFVWHYVTKITCIASHTEAWGAEVEVFAQDFFKNFEHFYMYVCFNGGGGGGGLCV